MSTFNERLDALLPAAGWPVETNAPLTGFNPPEADYKTEWSEQIQVPPASASTLVRWGSIVYTRHKPGSPGVFQVGISLIAKVYYGVTPTSFLSPTGVLSDELPLSTTTGWLDVVSGALLWFEVLNGATTAWATPTAAAVKYEGSSDVFGHSYFECDGGTGSPPYYTQTKLKAPVCRVWINADGSVIVELMPGRSLFLVTTGGDAYESGGAGPHPTQLLTWK